jgi:hypothetical protein
MPSFQHKHVFDSRHVLELLNKKRGTLFGIFVILKYICLIMVLFWFGLLLSWEFFVLVVITSICE